MDLQLAGKTAVVTGGSKGIGLAVVRLLQAEGVRVVTASRNQTPELKETGATHVAVDLTTQEGAEELIARANQELGGIDVLINNVGVGDADEMAKGVLHSVLDLPEDAWRHTFDLHFYSALRVTRAALPSLLARKGVVVNVSSIGARQVNAGAAHYNVAKAALNAFTKVVAEQFSEQGVRVITVSPGPVETQVWSEPDGVIAKMARHFDATPEEFRTQLLDKLSPSTGRISTPEEVAQLIVFAAAPNNINGVELIVDGGVTKQL